MDLTTETGITDKAQKSGETRPYEPSGAEQVVLWLERSGLLAPPRGLYPFLGSVYPGGGLAGGVALRLPYSDTGVLNTQTGWSVRNYKLGAATLTLPELAQGHVRVRVDARWIDAPQVPFYGIGPGSSAEARTTFRYRPRTFGITGHVRGGAAAAGGGFDYQAGARLSWRRLDDRR